MTDELRTKLGETFSALMRAHQVLGQVDKALGSISPCRHLLIPISDLALRVHCVVSSPSEVPETLNWSELPTTQNVVTERDIQVPEALLAEADLTIAQARSVAGTLAKSVLGEEGTF